MSIQSKKIRNKTISLCLGNILKNFITDVLKETGLNGYVSDFSLDCNITDINNILDTHKYLIKNM